MPTERRIHEGNPPGEPDIPAVLLSVRKAARALDMGKDAVYALVHEGELESVRVRGLIRVPVAALHRFTERQLEVERDRKANLLTPKRMTASRRTNTQPQALTPQTAA